MGKGKQQGGSFGQFINQIKGLILGLFGFVSAIVGFITLTQGNTELVALILLALGISLIWLTCLYFARFWRPEADDGKGSKKVGLVPSTQDDKQVTEQRRKERQRQFIRRLALLGLILVPLTAMGSYGTWMHVQTLPDDDVLILVADFDGPDRQNNRVTETILRQLREATDGYDDVEVVALGQAITEQAGSDQARKLAEKEKADIMIWGWYGQTAGTVPISANFELLEANEFIPDDLGNSATGAIQAFDVAELDSFSLQTRLSNEMSFLTLFTLGIADYANEEWADAISLFEDALRQTDDGENGLDLAPIHFFKGTAHLFNKDFEKAIVAYDQALAIKPDFHEALNNKGTALYDLGKLDEAIVAYDQALAIKPDYHEALYYKARVYSLKNDTDNALQALQKAITLYPDVRDFARNDSDLDNIRQDPRFQELISTDS